MARRTFAVGGGAGNGGASFAAAVGQWARRTEDRLARVLQDATSELAEAVIVGNEYSTGTPVDTGYARNSWVASFGAPSDALPLGPRTPGTRYDAGDGLAPVALTIAGFTVGQVLYLTNNTAYLDLLEYGYTVPIASDTPPGWIGQAVRQWPRIVADAVRRQRAASRAGDRL